MHPKSFPVVAVLAAAWGVALFAPTPSGGQTGEEINMVQLLNDVTAQGATLADNQQKIDAKLAIIGENIRLARIYAGRGR